MLKPADRYTIGTLLAFPNVVHAQRNASLVKARRLAELEAENARLRDTAIALALEIHDLRTGSAGERRNADKGSDVLIESLEITLLRQRRPALRHSWRRSR
jgi:hypothetical protein